MKTIMIDGLLGLMVLSAWIGCLGFARLRTPLDRVHCVAFVNATAGLAFAAAAFVADGPSVRAFKILLVVGILLVSGAATAHAIGRALLQRAAEGAQDHGQDLVPSGTAER